MEHLECFLTFSEQNFYASFGDYIFSEDCDKLCPVICVVVVAAVVVL